MNHLSIMAKKIDQIIDKYIPFETIIFMPKNFSYLPYIWVTGTYIIYSKKEIIYIGVSINLGNRLISHINNKHDDSFSKKITGIKIIRFHTWEEAEALEAYLINKLHPYYNKTIPPMFNYMHRLSSDMVKHLHELIEIIFQTLSVDNQKKVGADV